MTAVAFDTYKFIKELKDAGVTEGQAEAFQRVFSEAVGESLATKEDIKGLKHDISNMERKIDSNIEHLKNKIDSNNERLEHKIENLEQRITIRLGSIMVIGIAALAAIIKLL